jgi:hypothetical protein
MPGYASRPNLCNHSSALYFTQSIGAVVALRSPGRWSIDAEGAKAYVVRQAGVPATTQLGDGRTPMSSLALTASSLPAALQQEKFIRVPGGAMRGLVAKHRALADWDAFAASWDRLGPDTYMADGGRYRRRRHAVFACADQGAISRAPHQPHYQSRDYNSLNGGIERWFEPVEDSIGAGATCLALLGFCRETFAATAPGSKPWHVEMHQFRIEAKPGTVGKPTPEGMHRDGVDFVLVMMVKRTNIKSGETIMASADHKPLGQFTLIEPFDAVFLDDHHVFHGVTPVEALEPDKPAFRDVLVVTFRRQP